MILSLVKAPLLFLVPAIALGVVAPSSAQSASTNRSAGFGRGFFGPQVVSPEVSSDRRITFRLLATNAQTVRLNAGDIPGQGPGATLQKGTNGVWEVTLGPIDPGAYRYNFNVDGVSVIDPRNAATSESNNNTWSLVHVPGSELFDTREVPHGSVASVPYYSSVLKRFRRMHVYTPPGYERGGGKFPVFYLLHGAGDSDDSWSSVGRASFILDNLIASKRAKPMIVVMPAGHTGPFTFGGRGAGGGRPRTDEFVQEFSADILPQIEKSYRVHTSQSQRAIAGLSMGGSQTLNIAVPHLDQFGYIGVFSSGLFGDFGRRGTNGPPPGPTFEEKNREVLDNPKLKKGVKLVWFSTGKDDFVIESTRGTVAMLKKHGFNPVFAESTGGHTWINWRNYLAEFAPQLFR
jgi:enterochelin esterase-like enzyme